MEINKLLVDPREEMEKRPLLQTQRNDIFKLIKGLDINPLDFDFVKVNSNFVPNCIVTKVIYKSNYYFIFDYNDMHSTRYIKYFPDMHGKMQEDYPEEWDRGILPHVHNWLITIAREEKAPDLWESIFAEKKIIEGIVGHQLDNKPFTPEELDKIVKTKEQIEQYIINNPKYEEHHSTIKEYLNYTVESAKKGIGRIDWLNIIIGGFFSKLIDKVDINTLKELFRFVIGAFSKFLGGGGDIPLIG